MRASLSLLLALLAHALALSRPAPLRRLALGAGGADASLADLVARVEEHIAQPNVAAPSLDERALNRLLQALFDEGETALARRALDAQLDRGGLSARSLLFAVRELLKWDSPGARWLVGRAADTHAQGAGQAALELLQGLLSRNLLQELDAALAALSLDAGAAAEYRWLLGAARGDLAACALLWPQVRANLGEGLRWAPAGSIATAAVHTGVEAQAAPLLPAPDLSFALAAQSRPPSAVASLLAMDAEALASLANGYWAAGRKDLLATALLDQPLLSLRTKTFNQLLVCCRADRGADLRLCAAIRARVASGEVDRVTISSALDLCAAGGGDLALAGELHRLGARFGGDARVTHAYLRCFRESGQDSELAALRRSALKGRPDVRTLDELVHAHLRVGGRALLLGGLLPALRRTDRVGAAGVRHALIWTDRHWRDPLLCVSSAGALAAELGALCRLLGGSAAAKDELLWAALASVALAHVDAAAAGVVLEAMQRRLSAAEASRALELGVYSALEGALPLLTRDASAVVRALPRGLGVHRALASVPVALRLPAADRRLVCGGGSLVALLGALSEGPDRAPLGAHLLQSLFLDATGGGLRGEAARVLRLLERARLVLDLSEAELSGALGWGALDHRELRLGAEQARRALASRWAALLVGASLGRLTDRVRGSLGRAVAARARAGADGEDEDA